MKCKIAVIFFLMLVLFSCQNKKAQQSEIPSDIEETKPIEQYLFVNSLDGLNCRKNPGVDQEVIAFFPHKTKVQFLEEENKLVMIDGINAKWKKVKKDNVEGWVFGGYLVSSEDNLDTIILDPYRVIGTWVFSDSLDYLMNQKPKNNELEWPWINNPGSGLELRNDGGFWYGTFNSGHGEFGKYTISKNVITLTGHMYVENPSEGEYSDSPTVWTYHVDSFDDYQMQGLEKFKAEVKRVIYWRWDSPLSKAIEANDLNAVKTITADPSMLNQRLCYDKTPLIRATELGKNQIIEYLLLNGADPNLKDFAGFTALHYAVFNERFYEKENLIKILLEHKAKWDIKDHFDQTALDVYSKYYPQSEWENDMIRIKETFAQFGAVIDEEE